MKAAGLGFVLVAGAGVPATAQVFGPQVLACAADDEDAIQLGEFPTPMRAWQAARTHRIKSDQYAVATVRGRRVAIDSGGVIHPVKEGICVGSGQRMKPPQDE